MTDHEHKFRSIFERVGAGEPVGHNVLLARLGLGIGDPLELTNNGRNT